MIRPVPQTPPDPKPTNPWSLGMALLLTVLTALGVSAAGLALSYDAISNVGLAANMAAGRVWLLPVSVDGTMTVSTLAAMLLKLLTGKTPRYPMAVFLVCAALSAICNGMHAVNLLDLPSWCRIGVSVIPAVMGTLAPHLLFVIIEEAIGVFRGMRGAAPLHVPATAGAPLPAQVPAPAVAPQALGPAEAPPPADPVLEMPPAADEAPALPAVAEQPPAPRPAAPAPLSDPPHLEVVGEAGPREQARALFRQGVAPKDIAVRLGCSRKSAERYTKDLREPVAAGA